MDRELGTNRSRIVLKLRIVRGCIVAPVLLAFVLFAEVASAQVISGRVIEEASSVAIPGALVALLGADGSVHSRTLSDSTGHFTIAPSAAGEFYLESARFGYVRTRSPLLALSTAGVAQLDLVMTPEPIGLEGLQVSVDDEAEQLLEQFGHTPRSLGDRWISRSAIEAMPLPLGPREVIKGQRVSGVWVDETNGGPFDDFCLRFSRRLRQCALVVLNGVPFPSDHVQTIRPEEIESIAILTPIDATTFYGTQAGGGAVLIWTRRGGG